MRDLNLTPFSMVIGMVSLVPVIFGQGFENRSLKKEISSHVEYEIALNMLVHECWQADSVTFDEKVRTTDAFAKVDSLREGYWEDIFFQWQSKQQQQNNNNMKNYMLLSTCVKNAIDDIAIAIELGENQNINDVKRAVDAVFPWSWLSVSPIGRPETFKSLNEAIDILREAKFHEDILEHVKDTAEIVSLPERTIACFNDLGHPVVKLVTTFEESNTKLVADELDIINRVYDILDGHVSYYKNRSQFRVEDYMYDDTKWHKVYTWGVISGSLVKKTVIFRRVTKEITRK